MSLRRFDPILAIEACYSGVPDNAAWLDGIARAFEPLEQGFGVYAILWDVRGGVVHPVAQAARGPVPLDIETAAAVWCAAPKAVVERWFHPPATVDTFQRRIARLPTTDFSSVRGPFADRGALDALGVTTRDPAGRALQVWLNSARPVRVGPRARHRLSRVSAHLGSAARLRALAHAPPEAVLDPGGRVLHAEGEARPAAARASLAAAVRRTERARGQLRRADPDDAVDLWSGLVEGNWSLVDHVEADGRRLVLARRNAPGAADPKALTPRERDVLAYVVQGHSNKYVAYALGLSGATIAAHLKGAIVKLGVRSRGELISLLSGTATSPANRSPASGRARGRPHPGSAT
ncbi:MAG: helix-turn-helix transcriptional regulator [Anaeromyxobacteraceae bacterium]